MQLQGVYLVCWSLISHFLGLWRRPRLLLHFSREIKSRFRNPKFPPDLLVAALMYYISLHFTSFHCSPSCLRGVQSISCFSWSKLTRRWVCMQKAMRGRDHSQISKTHNWGGGGGREGGGGGGGGGRGHRWWGGAELKSTKFCSTRINHMRKRMSLVRSPNLLAFETSNQAGTLSRWDLVYQ